MAKILVVDDEKVLVKGITFNLKNEGYQVETGYDGEEAVELGLIDEIGGLSDALACLHKMIEQRNQEKTEGLRDSPAP